MILIMTACKMTLSLEEFYFFNLQIFLNTLPACEQVEQVKERNKQQQCFCKWAAFLKSTNQGMKYNPEKWKSMLCIERWYFVLQ